MRNDIIAKRLRRFGPRALFHVTPRLDLVLLEDEISGGGDVHLTTDPERAIQLAAAESGPAAGIVVLDRGLAQPMPVPTDFAVEGIYPLSHFAVGLLWLRDEGDHFSDQRFGLHFAYQMQAMERRYADNGVRSEDIEPLNQLADAMVAHIHARYIEEETFARLFSSGFLANRSYYRDALDRLHRCAPTRH